MVVVVEIIGIDSGFVVAKPTGGSVFGVAIAAPFITAGGWVKRHPPYVCAASKLPEM